MAVAGSLRRQHASHSVARRLLVAVARTGRLREALRLPGKLLLLQEQVGGRRGEEWDSSLLECGRKLSSIAEWWRTTERILRHRI